MIGMSVYVGLRVWKLFACVLCERSWGFDERAISDSQLGRVPALQAAEPSVD
jgi:hypothetical protein